MNNIKNIYAALDIGSGYIKGIIAEVYEGELFILASSLVKSDGFGAGAIINEEALVEKINVVVQDLSKQIDMPVNNFVVGLPSYSVQITKLYGETFITNSDNRIKAEDIQRAIINACEKYEEPGYEIVNVIPSRYNVDGFESDVALGLNASKFGIEVLGLVAEGERIYPYLSAVEKAGVEVLDICLLSLAEQYEIKEQLTSIESFIAVNVGYASTSLSIANDNVLKGIGTYNLGIKRIAFECAKDFKINQDSLLKHIEEFGVNFQIDEGETKKFESIEGSMVEHNLSVINAHLIHLLTSLLITIKKEVDKYIADQDYDLVFIGGLNEIPGIESLIEKVFNFDGHILKSSCLGARNSAYLPSFGLVRYIVNKMKERGKLSSSFGYDVQAKLTTPKKKMWNVSDDSVIGKLYGRLNDYFFGKE